MMHLVHYSSHWDDSLRKFLYNNFPHRNKKYLDWWLNQSLHSKKDLQNRTFMVVDESNRIVACTTALWTKMKIRTRFYNMYWAGNTIVDENYRGKGIGRMVYEQMNLFRDRCSTGFTKAAYAIQPKIIKQFTNLSSVFVYLSFNICFMRNLWDRLLRNSIKQDDLIYPNQIDIKHVHFERVDNIELIEFPSDGFWQNDTIELIRDKDFFRKRFIDIYRKYIIYQSKVDNEIVGYFVVRPAKYKGFNLLSLVDFRYKNENIENSIIKAVAKIARNNKIGMFITLTSLKKKFLSSGCTIRTSKVLYGGTTMAEIKEDDFMLITSADSDLDFVYYG